jgi:beta-lactamase regulating signal transducer with metallopeptidase domain
MSILFIDRWVSAEVVRTVCWTLIHSLWQGLLAAILAGIIIIGTRKAAARLRYNLLTAVFILFLGGSVITFFTQLHYGNINISAASEHAGISEGTFVHEPQTGFFATQQQHIIEQAVTYFDVHAPLIVLIWIMFFLGQSIKLMAGFYQIYRIRHNNIYPPSREWNEKMYQMAEKLGIKKKIILLQSGLIKMPAIAGILKPTILLPLGIITNLPPDQIETILLHELAHIKRKDYLLNLIQYVSESIFFFNPGLRWISSLIRQEREACCDDIVLLHSPHKKPYIEALVNFQEFSLHKHTYAMRLGGHQNHLYDRVKRMLKQENKKLNIIEKLALIVGLMVITAFSFLNNESEKPVPPKQDTYVKTTNVSANNRDTLPKAYSRNNSINFRQINSHIDNNDTHSLYEAEATDDKGNVYKVKKINGEVKEFSLNGTPVEPQQLEQYTPLINAIEAGREHTPRNIFKHDRRSQTTNTSSLFDHKKNGMFLHKADSNVTAEKSRTSLFNKKAARNNLFKSKPRVRKGDEYVEKIVKDLVDVKLLENTNTFSFNLNNESLLVNGQPQPASIHNQFKNKYIKSPKDRIIYSYANGTTKFDISIE